ncbi:MAG: hypothetical protein LBM28_00685 [Oscillospiraceae bacterium]|jgi:hypothetical protein|nr:hypothetical protein [Oscillospiraceae bacterium]
MKKKWVIPGILVLALLLASLAVLMIVRANAPKKVWYADSVDYVMSRGLMEEDGTGDFDPEGLLTRERLAVVLWRLCGQPTPPDPEEIFRLFDYGEPSSWAKDATYWALGYSIIMPIMHEYNPNEPPGGILGFFEGQSAATREQLVEALFRFARYSGVASSKRAEFDFSDRLFSSWAAETTQWCAEEGLLEIYSEGDTLLPSPQKEVTRAEAAVIIARFCEIYDAAVAQP